MATTNFSFPRIDAARSTVEEELEIVGSEAEAFEGFRSRLRRLEPRAVPTHSGGGSLVASSARRGIDPSAVREAYRETVMGTSHHDREYGTSLQADVEAEFGSPVSDLLVQTKPITAVQRNVIESAVSRAIEERTQFQRSLEAEFDSLTAIEDRLTGLERRYREVKETPIATAGRAGQLQELAEGCQSLAAKRQQAIHQGPTPTITGIGNQSLVAFLYGDSDHRFPALVEIIDLAHRIEAAIWR